jgi:hypothetical protein
MIASISYDTHSTNVTSLAPNHALHEMATLRARSSGSDVILPRHLTEAAQALKQRSSGTSASPSATLPVHYDFLCDQLSKLNDLVTADANLRSLPPRVLVVGETSGVVPPMFQMAGAQVAACDLYPSEIEYVPHSLGDCKYIQDIG